MINSRDEQDFCIDFSLSSSTPKAAAPATTTYFSRCNRTEPICVHRYKIITERKYLFNMMEIDSKNKRI